VKKLENGFLADLHDLDMRVKQMSGIELDDLLEG